MRDDNHVRPVGWALLALGTQRARRPVGPLLIRDAVRPRRSVTSSAAGTVGTALPDLPPTQRASEVAGGAGRQRRSSVPVKDPRKH